VTTVWESLAGTSFAIRQLEVGRWSTRVLEAGGGDETVILMSGNGGHLEAYAKNISVLASRYRVVAYDYPGHGWSDLSTEPLELPVYVDHLRELMDVLGVSRAHLNGESLGGWLAVKFAVAYPERVGRIVLNTPGGYMAKPEVMNRIRTLSQAAADDPSPEQVRARLEWLMADPATVTDELVGIRRAIYSRPGFSESMSHILCLQDPEIRRRNMITDSELAAVKSRTLVVWTSDDPSGPASVGLDMSEKIQDARFELITGAGHWPQWEQSERFNEVVLSFLGEEE
jgi:2-hydroxy-6-oxonona-2,4-dienedioate hydrolase